MFCDIVASHNDHPSYVKNVLRGIHVFFTLFGGWVLKVDSLLGGLAEGEFFAFPSSFSMHTSGETMLLHDAAMMLLHIRLLASN